MKSEGFSGGSFRQMLTTMERTTRWNQQKSIEIKNLLVTELHESRKLDNILCKKQSSVFTCTLVGRKSMRFSVASIAPACKQASG